MICRKIGKESRGKTKCFSSSVSTAEILFLCVSPFSQEVRARSIAYSFLYFQHIALGLAVSSCLSCIAEQIEHVSEKGRRIPSHVGLDKHVHQMRKAHRVPDFIGSTEMNKR